MCRELRVCIWTLVKVSNPALHSPAGRCNSARVTSFCLGYCWPSRVSACPSALRVTSKQHLLSFGASRSHRFLILRLVHWPHFEQACSSTESRGCRGRKTVSGARYHFQRLDLPLRTAFSASWSSRNRDLCPVSSGIVPMWMRPGFTRATQTFRGTLVKAFLRRQLEARRPRLPLVRLAQLRRLQAEGRSLGNLGENHSSLAAVLERLYAAAPQGGGAEAKAVLLSLPKRRQIQFRESPNLVQRVTTAISRL